MRKPIDEYKRIQAMRNTIHPAHEPDELSAGVFFAKVLIVVIGTVLLLGWLGLIP